MRVLGWADRAASALAGALLGALVVLGVQGLGRVPPPGGGAAPSSPTRPSAPAEPPDGPGAFVAWAPGGLAPGTGRALRDLQEVSAVAAIGAGLDWIVRTRAPDGSTVDDPPGGLMIPFELAAIAPRSYAHFVPPAERAAILSLRPGEVVLAETSARLRRAREGMTIELDDRELVVSAIVSDAATNGYEGLVRAPAPDSWTRVDRFFLIAAEGADGALRRVVGRTRPSALRARGETPFLRYGDAVHPQMLLKANFGEFAARPRPDGTLEVDPDWRKLNIVTRAVPILGQVTCHRALFPQLRAALAQVAAEGLERTIAPADYGGCYSARFISLDPEGRLSHHSWGVAIDLNASANSFGTRPNQDPALVEVMEAWGFTWGGRWQIPDGMHFEWRRFP